jgi:hypothetical protein
MATISNSTIAANTLRGDDGNYGTNGGAGSSGGLWLAAGATAQVSFSTIAAKQATGGTHGTGGSDGPATGGGVYDQGLLQTRNTLVAGNIVDGPGTDSSPDLAGDLGSLGHNLVGNTQGGSGFDATDLLNVDPLLAPLQDNGGPTQTMALLPGSPAVGTGDPAGHPRWDQRGYPYRRVIDGRMDIGAFEVQSDGFASSANQSVRAPTLALAALASSLTAPIDQSTEWTVGAATQGSTLSVPGHLPTAQYVSTAVEVARVDRLFASLPKKEPRLMASRCEALDPGVAITLCATQFPEAIWLMP